MDLRKEYIASANLAAGRERPVNPTSALQRPRRRRPAGACMIELRTLGSIELHADDGARIESVLRHPKRVSLLAYLCASSPPRLHRRDTLVALLWPELDESHARGALRQELYQLRRTLGAEVVRGERADSIGVGAGQVWSDVEALEAALDEGRYADALALWRGDFLPGLHLDGGEFERWLDEVRGRLSHRIVDAARRLVDEAEEAGDLPGAIGWARRLTELAPYDETGWQRLMRLLDRHGDRAGALQACDALTDRLAAELEVAPSPETIALAGRIRSREHPFAPAGAGERGRPGRGPARRPGSRPPARSVPVPTPRVVVGLLPAENATGDPALDAVARLVTDRLAQGIAGLMFADIAATADAGGVTAVVSTTIYRHGTDLEAVPRLVRPGPEGRVIEMPRSVLLSADAPHAMLDRLAASVMVSVAAHFDPRFDAAATREGSLPIPTPLWEAYLEYLRGSELFGQYRFEDGYRHLRRAHEIDPDFVKAGIFAAIALAACGDPVAAERLVEDAMAPGRPLCEYERTLGEWFRADLRGQRVEAYRAAYEGILTSSSPAQIGIAGREALRMNRPREALRRLEGLELDRGWWRHWTEYFEWIGGAHHMLGSHRAELARAREGRARFPGSLEAIRAEVRARVALGQEGRVLKLVEEALTLPAGLSSPATVGWVAAQELEAHGQPAAAVRARGTAISWLQQHPRPSPAERVLLVRLLLESGDVASAASLLAGFGPPTGLDELEVAGLVAAHAGDSAAARDVVVRLEELRNPYLSGRHLLAAAGVRALLDPPEVAIATLRQAFAEGLPFGVELHALPALRPLSRHPAFQQLLRTRD
jgi:DNA-binding SARP family transcriptional activator